MPHDVQLVTTSPTTVAVIRFHVDHQELPTIGERMGHAFGTVMARLAEAHVSPDGPAIACYEPRGGDGFDVAAGFRVDPAFTAPPGLERLDLAEVEAAHTTHLGPYSELSTAYEELQTTVEASGRSVARGAPTWEEYWSGPDTPEDQTRTDIYWPLDPVH